MGRLRDDLANKTAQVGTTFGKKFLEQKIDDLGQNDVIGLKNGFHWFGFVVTVLDDPQGSGHGPDFGNPFIFLEFLQLAVGGRRQVLNQNHPLGTLLGRGGVVAFVLENSEPDGGRGEPDDDRRRGLVGASGKSAGAESLLDGVGKLGEGGDIPLGFCSCQDGFEELVIDLSIKIGFRIRPRKVEQAEHVAAGLLLAHIVAFFEELYLLLKGGDGLGLGGDGDLKGLDTGYKVLNFGLTLLEGNNSCH